MDRVLLIHSFIFRDWGCVRPLAVVNNAAVSMRVRHVHVGWMFWIPWRLLSLILRERRAVPAGGAIFQPHQQCSRVPVPLHPHQHCLFSAFLIITI